MVLGLVSLVEKASHDDEGDSCSADLQFLSLQITHENTRKKDYKNGKCGSKNDNKWQCSLCIQPHLGGHW